MSALGQKQTFCDAPRHVRFIPESSHRSIIARSPRKIMCVPLRYIKASAANFAYAYWSERRQRGGRL